VTTQLRAFTRGGRAGTANPSAWTYLYHQL